MTKLESLVSNPVFKFLMPVLGICALGLIGAIFNLVLAGQNDNKKAIDAHCTQTAAELKSKVDEKYFDELFKVVREDQKEQKTLNKELVKTMQELQIHMRIVKQKLE